MNSAHLLNPLPDETFLRLLWKARFGSELNLVNPESFNEKMQWLKLYDRDPLHTLMVDKHAVKAYVAPLIGEEHVIPTLGVWTNPDNIDFSVLPERFVLKCNHTSGEGLILCRDKTRLNREKAIRELRKAMKDDYYLTYREWPYKDVPRKIIAEPY
ncbi:MAG: glycosyl transferase, partial [Oscillospiraceae bacterium]|nr:glycosyl transferase [Oscillospiraceae bacterium]